MVARLRTIRSNSRCQSASFGAFWSIDLGQRWHVLWLLLGLLILRRPVTAIANPTPDRFFDIDAFAAPTTPGRIGNSGIGILTGPGTVLVHAALARAFGLAAWDLGRAADPSAALEEALAAPGPCLVNVPIPRDENVYPMVPPGAANREMMTGGELDAAANA